MVAKNLLLGIATSMAALTLMVAVMTVQPVLAPRSCAGCNEIAMGHGEDVSRVAVGDPGNMDPDVARGHGEDVSAIATAPR